MELTTQKIPQADENLPGENRLKEFWLIFSQNRLAIAGLICFIIFFVVALTGLACTSGQDPLFDPAQVRLQEKLKAPFSMSNPEILTEKEVPRLGLYILGTDDLGRDLFARMLQGAWVSLTVGFVAVGLAVIIGIFLGGIAGYFGNRHLHLYQFMITCIISSGVILMSNENLSTPGAALFVFGHILILLALIFRKQLKDRGRFLMIKVVSIDTLIMRLVDIMLCFPSFFLILTVVALLPASIYNIMIIIGLTSWMGTTRFVRAEFLSLREQDFVTAAKALGISDFRIIFRHIMPNAIAPVLVSSTIGIATAILTEAGLSFLGFGVPPPHATWGNILSDGKGFIFDAPWLTLIPGITILVVVLSFNLFGEGLKDALNPKLREAK